MQQQVPPTPPFAMTKGLSTKSLKSESRSSTQHLKPLISQTGKTASYNNLKQNRTPTTPSTASGWSPSASASSSASASPLFPPLVPSPSTGGGPPSNPIFRLLPPSLSVSPLDFDNNRVRIVVDVGDEHSRYYKVPDLLSKTVGDVVRLITDQLRDEGLVVGQQQQQQQLIGTLCFLDTKKKTYPLANDEKLVDVAVRWNPDMAPYFYVESKRKRHVGNVVGNVVVGVGNVVSTAAKGMFRKDKKGQHREQTDSTTKAEIEKLAQRTDFGDTQFAPSTWVESLFKERKEKFIRDLLEEHLVEAARIAEQDLQQSVHSNYMRFMETSTQIEVLEGEVVELRNYLTEVNSLLKGLNSVNLNVYKAPLTIPDRAPKLVGQMNTHIHWFLELPDELDILTSERLFEQAITSLHKAKKLIHDNPQLAIADAYIKEELNRRIKNLSEILLKDLQNPAIKKSESQQIINYLRDLDFASKAREVFLQTRSRQLKNELSTNLSFDGDVRAYVDELSRIVFTSIRSTCDDFRQSFDKHSMMSGFVVWTMKVLRQYRTQFTRHVFDFGDREDFELMGQCFERAKTHCVELEERGLSLIFYLQQSFQRDLLKSIDTFQRRLETSINRQFSEEKWECREAEGQPKMSDSGIYVHTVVNKFRAVISLINPESVDVVIATLALSLEKYLFELSTHVDSVRLSNKQYLGIVANAQHLSECLPEIEKELETKLNAGVDEVKSLRARLHALYVDIKDSYCKFQSNDIVNNNHRLDWGNTKYNMAHVDVSSLVPSQKLIKLFEYLYSVATDVFKILGKDAVRPITTNLLEQVLLGLTQGPFWKDEKNTKVCMFSEGGISQFILDMKYTIEASGPFITDKAKAVISMAIERALIHYCLATNVSPKKVLMDESWYRKIINATLETSKTLSNKSLIPYLN